MIIFTLRRLLLLLVTLFFLNFVGFSLSYFTPHAPLQGSSLWDAWLFWFNGLLHWDFGVSSINGQLISEQLKEVFPATMELCILAFGFALMVGIPVGMLAGIYRNKWQDKFISALALLGRCGCGSRCCCGGRRLRDLRRCLCSAAGCHRQGQCSCQQEAACSINRVSLFHR